MGVELDKLDQSLIKMEAMQVKVADLSLAETSEVVEAEVAVLVMEAEVEALLMVVAVAEGKLPC